MSPRSAPWLLALLTLGASSLAIPGCGDGMPPSADTSKRVPVLPARYQRKDLATWLALPADAPAEQRAAQAWALAALETDPIRAAPRLLRLLQDDDPSVRISAVIAAGRLAPPSARLAVVLTELMGSDDEPLRRHAREAVGRLGAVALPPLSKALADSRVRVRWGALLALRSLHRAGEPAADAVAALAREDSEVVVRRQARFTLARLGPKGARACAAFLASEDASERDGAAAALVHSGKDGIGPLLGLIQGEAEVPAAVAAGVLADLARATDLGPEAGMAALVLVKALAREGPVRFNATDALAGLGEGARPALEALETNGSKDLKAIATMLLEGLNAERAKSGLVR